VHYTSWSTANAAQEKVMQVVNSVLLKSVLLSLCLVFVATARASEKAYNSNTSLVPITKFESPVLEFDFPGMLVGVAEYEEGPTGATVFYFPEKVKAAVDARGGSPGTINAEFLNRGYESKDMDAIVLSGGSWYGLSAGTGVANAIKDKTTDPGHWLNIAGVAAAIIFDLGSRRFTDVTPDDALGRAALNAAKPGRFPLGARGAGRFALQGSYFSGQMGFPVNSGQGGAFAQIGPTKIAVFAVVNSIGTIVDRSGNVMRCGLKDQKTTCGPVADMFTVKASSIQRKVVEVSAGSGKTKNTTISLVVTNQKLPHWALSRLAVQVHSSMARAIQPFSTESDGDVLFAVTTDEVENSKLSPRDLGMIASELAWDAILSSIPEPDLLYPSEPVNLNSDQIQAYAARYRFSPTAAVDIRVENDHLIGMAIGDGGAYFPEDREFKLTAVGPALFRLDTTRGDHLQFEIESGSVIGLTLNPGHWSQSAHREDS
jgi:L-aminopeptidase/D-esterase-like protein